MKQPLDSDEIEKEDHSNYLAPYHGWLRLMARLQLDGRWNRKFDASDILQQTLLEAWIGESAFQGNTTAERIAWLRTILGRVIGREVRKYDGTQMRDPGRELSLQRSIDQSSILLDKMLAAETDTPSVHADNREQQTIIADVIESLPEDYREVIVLRNLRGFSHAEIAKKLERNESAVRMLWLRALNELRTRVLARQ
ncbi:RNA polymerase sigma factor [Novipirellula aureliae]|uniref:RNA polymerase sigma factor n=1 Tax=Novipirellula aureliae TaxID=2527966 RepID=A0A5C6DCT2_9BACT|nr:sigma-70 family RNA polymerase sigma factor [Novipirellula aureliae]TWU34582.1 RNA polymerase sigma factor [Novipirellula aureliae]